MEIYKSDDQEIAVDSTKELVPTKTEAEEDLYLTFVEDSIDEEMSDESKTISCQSQCL